MVDRHLQPMVIDPFSPARASAQEIANRAPQERKDLDSDAFSVFVATDFEDPSLDRAVWDHAVASLGGSVYMTWDWLRTWWGFYGNGHQLRLIVCSFGQQVTALMPMYIESVGFGPLRARVARFVGANIPPKVFDPPLARDWASPCFNAVYGQLIGVDRCDLISFGPVSTTSTVGQSFLESAAHSEDSIRVECDTSEVHTLFVLPESEGEYLKSLGKNEQKNRRKYELRTLKKEHDVKVDVISGPVESLLQEFDDFATLHAAQWRAEGRSGHFGSWPDGLAYNRALVSTLGPLDRVRFVRITASGVTVSSQYIFAFAGRWYWELPARQPSPEWDRFSLGPSGIVTMIGEAISLGVHWIQGGLAHYDYKLRLRAQEHPVLMVRVYSTQVASRFRKAIFDGLRRALRLCYHKLWYRRVMPILPPRFRRAQSRLWLRWDF